MVIKYETFTLTNAERKSYQFTANKYRLIDEDSHILRNRASAVKPVVLVLAHALGLRRLTPSNLFEFFLEDNFQIKRLGNHSLKA